MFIDDFELISVIEIFVFLVYIEFEFVLVNVNMDVGMIFVFIEFCDLSNDVFFIVFFDLYEIFVGILMVVKVDG